MAFALIVTMLLAGLWHGAAWNFVAFGLFYGILQAAWMLMPGAQALSSSKSLPARVASHAITISLVLVAWVIFRSESLSAALSTTITAIAGAPQGRVVPLGVVEWLLAHTLPFALVLALARGGREEADIADRPVAVLAAAYVTMAILLASSEGGRDQFIYFQF